MKRVCVVITARPSYSRVKTVLEALQVRSDVELQVIAAGAALVRRFGSVRDQITADGFPVVAEIPSVVEGDSTREAAVATGLLVTQLASVMAMLRPDVVVTIADRHETLATAIAASYQNIPLCHIQGGEVSGSIDDKVRYAVTALSDIHCVATDQARVYVLGVVSKGSDSIHVTGCPGIDLAKRAMELGPLNKGPEIVVLQHSDTTHEHDAAAQIRETIKALHTFSSVQWFWPGEDAGGDAMAKELRMAGIKATRTMEPVEFLRLLLGAKVLVGNSSVGIRECSLLGVPVVNIGDRQKGRECGPNVVNVPHDSAVIHDAVRRELENQPEETPVFKPTGPARYIGVTLYGDGHAGERIASILATGTAEAAA